MYAAKLEWRSILLHYSSLITHIRGAAKSESSLRGFEPPSFESGVTELNLPHLGFRGRWTTLSDPQKRTIFEDENGSVDWLCVQPNADCQLDLPGQERMPGLGYVECLTLTIPPWELPLEELHWGRFLNHENYVVWIDWRGPYHKRLVLRNGEEQMVQALTESSIVFAGGELNLDRQTNLRQGRLGQTVFSALAPLRKILPNTMLAVQEEKWLSRGGLVCDGRRHSGWAIHEVVTWKQ